MQYHAWFRCTHGEHGQWSLEEVVYRCPTCNALLEVAHARVAMESSTRRWIDLALGESEVGDRDAIVRILEAVLFASMVGLVTGGRAPADVADELELAARTLLGER